MRFFILSFLGTLVLYLSGWTFPQSYELSTKNIIAINFFGGYVSDSLVFYSYGLLIHVNDVWYGTIVDYDRFLDSPFLSWVGLGFAFACYIKAFSGLFESR